MYILTKALAADAESIRTVIEQIWKDSPLDTKNKAALFRTLDQTHSSAVIAQEIESGEKEYLLLKKSEGIILAFASYSVLQANQAEMVIHQLYDVIHSRGWKNQIILIDRIEKESKSRHLRCISLTLSELGKVQLFESLGFIATADHLDGVEKITMRKQI